MEGVTDRALPLRDTLELRAERVASLVVEDLRGHGKWGNVPELPRL